MALDQIAHTPEAVVSMGFGLNSAVGSKNKETQASISSVPEYAVISCSSHGVKPDQKLG